MELDSKLSELFQGCLTLDSRDHTGCNVSSSSMSSGVDEEAEDFSDIFSVTYNLWSEADESKLKMSLSNGNECLQTACKPCQEKNCINELDMKLEAMKAFGSSYSNFVETSVTTDSMDIWAPIALDQPSIWNNLQGFKETWIPPASLPKALNKAKTDKCFECVASPEATAEFNDSELQLANVDNGTAIWEKSLCNPKTIQAPHTTVQLSAQSNRLLSAWPRALVTDPVNSTRKNFQQVCSINNNILIYGVKLPYLLVFRF
jgi:hypothetical protein